MNFNKIKLTFLTTKNKEKSINEIDPFINKIIKNCNIKNISSIKLNVLFNKNQYFYFSNQDFKNIKDKIFAIIINLLGKNIRSRLCSYKNIIKKDLLETQSNIIFIANYSIFYELIKYQFPLNFSSSVIYINNIYRKYPWKWELIKNIISNKQNENISCCIIYNCFTINFIKFIHTLLPKAKIVCRYHDMIFHPYEKHIIYNLKKLTYCNIESYSFIDSKQLQLNFNYNSVNFDKFNKLINIFPNNHYDIYFLGNVSGERFKFIKNLISFLCEKQIKFYFDAVIFNNKDNYINKLYDINKLKKSGSIVQTSPLSYNVYIKNLLNCKVVIDLYRLTPDEGLSFRTAEALALKKKIITNRDLNANNLYKFKENILFFDDIDKVDLRKFIDKPYVDPDPELLKQFDINEQIKNYLKN